MPQTVPTTRTDCPKCDDGVLVDQTPVGLPADVDNGCMCQSTDCDFQSAHPMGNLDEDLIDVTDIDALDEDFIPTSADGYEDGDPSPTYTVTDDSGDEIFRLLLTTRDPPATGTAAKYVPLARRYPA